MTVKVTVYQEPNFLKRVAFEGFESTLVLPSSPGLEALGVTSHHGLPGSQHYFVASVVG